MTRHTGAKCCARCGRRQPRERLVKNSRNGRYYCASRFIEVCDSRVKRQTGKTPRASFAQAFAEAERYYTDEAYREAMPWAEVAA